MGADHEVDGGDDEFVASITPDVMACLASRGFFEELDSRLCPSAGSCEPERCGGNHEISTSILQSQGFDDADIADILAVLRSQGGNCDCEILYNVVETSGLKSKHWRAAAARAGDWPFETW
jgi:hypothetical protein